LLHLCAAALGNAAPWNGPAWLIHWIFDRQDFKFQRLPGLEPGAARRDLGILLADFLRAPDLDLLPLRRVVELAEDADPFRPEQGGGWAEALEKDWLESSERRFGGRSRDAVLRALNPGTPVDAEAKIQRRLLPFLRWRSQWREEK
jgi:hypothetical protein